jgi:hypothetical protein
MMRKVGGSTLGTAFSAGSDPHVLANDGKSRKIYHKGYKMNGNTAKRTAVEGTGRLTDEQNQELDNLEVGLYRLVSDDSVFVIAADESVETDEETGELRIDDSKLDSSGFDVFGMDLLVDTSLDRETLHRVLEIVNEGEEDEN